MNSKTKNKIFLFSVVITLFLAIGNYNSILNSNEKISNSLEVETEAKSIEQIGIKTSGDNDFSALWISGNIGPVDRLSIGDQDSDGKGELIIARQPYIQVFEYNTTYENYSLVKNFDLGSVPAVCSGGDLDKDGEKEIVVGSSSAFYFRVFEYNGNDNDYDPVFQRYLGSDSQVLDICIGDDLDGDGTREIVIGDGRRVNVSENNGADDSYDSTWVSNVLSGYIQDVCTANDLDEDGYDEILVGTGKTYVFENAGDNTFNGVWNRTIDTNSVCFGDDLDNDGKKELVVGSNDNFIVIYEYNGTNNGYEQVWNSSLTTTIGGPVYSVCIGDDLDGDGKNEIIAGCGDDKVYVFEYDGTDNGYSKIWDSDSIIKRFVKNVAVSDDHNNDGKKELIAATEEGSYGKFYIFQHEDTTPQPIIIEDDDDDDDDDEKGIYISTTTLIIGGAISAIAIAVVITLLIKRKR